MDLVNRKRVYCPYCNREHEVDVAESFNEFFINGNLVKLKQCHYVCGNVPKEDGGSNTFVDGALLNQNLKQLRKACRTSSVAH